MWFHVYLGSRVLWGGQHLWVKTGNIQKTAPLEGGIFIPFHPTISWVLFPPCSRLTQRISSIEQSDPVFYLPFLKVSNCSTHFNIKISSKSIHCITLLSHHWIHGLSCWHRWILKEVWEVCNLDGFSEASWHPIQIFDLWWASTLEIWKMFETKWLLNKQIRSGYCQDVCLALRHLRPDNAFRQDPRHKDPFSAASTTSFNIKN